MSNLVCKHNKNHTRLRASKENPGFYMCDICKDGWRKEELQINSNQNANTVNQFIFRLDNLSDNNNREHLAYLQISDYLQSQISNLKADLIKYPNLKPHMAIQSGKMDFNSSLKIITFSDMIHTNVHFKDAFDNKNWIRFTYKNQFFIPNSVLAYSELQLNEQGIKIFGSYGSYWLDTNLFESLNLSWNNLGV